MRLSDMTPPELECVVRFGRRRELTEGQYVIHEGANDQALFLLLHGTVEVVKKLDTSTCKSLRQLQEGDFFGEISFLGISERTASVVALGPCAVVELTPEAFARLVKENPEVGIRLLRNIARDLACRLKKTTDELKKTVVWVLADMEL